MDVMSPAAPPKTSPSGSSNPQTKRSSLGRDSPALVRIFSSSVKQIKKQSPPSLVESTSAAAACDEDACQPPSTPLSSNPLGNRIKLSLACKLKDCDGSAKDAASEGVSVDVQTSGGGSVDVPTSFASALATNPYHSKDKVNVEKICNQSNNSRTSPSSKPGVIKLEPTRKTSRRHPNPDQRARRSPPDNYPRNSLTSPSSDVSNTGKDNNFFIRRSHKKSRKPGDRRKSPGVPADDRGRCNKQKVSPGIRGSAPTTSSCRAHVSQESDVLVASDKKTFRSSASCRNGNKNERIQSVEKNLHSKARQGCKSPYNRGTHQNGVQRMAVSCNAFQPTPADTCRVTAEELDWNTDHYKDLRQPTPTTPQDAAINLMSGGDGIETAACSGECHGRGSCDLDQVPTSIPGFTHHKASDQTSTSNPIPSLTNEFSGLSCQVGHGTCATSSSQQNLIPVTTAVDSWTKEHSTDLNRTEADRDLLGLCAAEADIHVLPCQSATDVYDLTHSQSDGEECNVEFYQQLSDAAGEMAGYSNNGSSGVRLPWQDMDNYLVGYSCHTPNTGQHPINNWEPPDLASVDCVVQKDLYTSSRLPIEGVHGNDEKGRGGDPANAAPTGNHKMCTVLSNEGLLQPVAMTSRHDPDQAVQETSNIRTRRSSSDADKTSSSGQSDNSWAEYNKHSSTPQPIWALTPELPPHDLHWEADRRSADYLSHQGISQVEGKVSQSGITLASPDSNCLSLGSEIRFGRHSAEDVLCDPSWEIPVKKKRQVSDLNNNMEDESRQGDKAAKSRLRFRSYDSFRQSDRISGVSCCVTSSTPNHAGFEPRNAVSELPATPFAAVRNGEPDESVFDSPNDSSNSLGQIALSYPDSDMEDERSAVGATSSPDRKPTEAKEDKPGAVNLGCKSVETYKAPHRRFSDAYLSSGGGVKQSSASACTPIMSKFSINTSYWTPDRSPISHPDPKRPASASPVYQSYAKPTIRSRRPLFCDSPQTPVDDDVSGQPPSTTPATSLPVTQSQWKADEKMPDTRRGPRVLWCSGMRRKIGLAGTGAYSRASLSALDEKQVVTSNTPPDDGKFSTAPQAAFRRKSDSFTWSATRPIGPELPKPTATVHPIVLGSADPNTISKRENLLPRAPRDTVPYRPRFTPANTPPSADWLPWKEEFKKRHGQHTVKYIDTHCHIDFILDRSGFVGTFTEYLADHKDTLPDNYAGCVAIFCNPRTFTLNNKLWQAVLPLDKVWGAIGCHPKSALDFTVQREMAMKALLHRESKFKAVGEIGLDYSGHFHQYHEVQKAVFIRQLKIAVELNKPIVIHAREAEEDCIEILKQHVPTDWKIHRHCFTGTLEEARTWIQTFPNSYLGLTPLVTHRSERAYGAREVARFIPLRKLLLETDAPYFTPRMIPREEMRLTHPGLAITVAGEIAFLKSLSVAEVLQNCLKNSLDMYDLTLE